MGVWFVLQLALNYPTANAQQGPIYILGTKNPRYWHVFLYAAGAAAILIAADFLFLRYTGIVPGLKDTWWLVLLIAFLCGAGVTLGCGGAAISKRIISTAVWGILTGILYTAASSIIMQAGNIIPGELTVTAAWQVFIFTIFGTIAAVITELRLPDPNIKT